MAPIPTPPRLLAVLMAVQRRLDAAGIAWRLAGGTGRLLLGLPGRPGDVDIEVSAADAPGAAAVLGLPAPTHTEGAGWSSLRSQGTLAGVPVDLSGGLAVQGPGGRLDAADADVVAVRFGSGTVAVEAPGESVARAVVAGDAAREARARGRLPQPPDDALAYAARRIGAATG